LKVSFNVGAKTMAALQNPPSGGVGTDCVQEPPVLVKPPPRIVGDCTIAVAGPLFVTVKISGELDCPTATDPKLKANGEMESCGLAPGGGPLKMSISGVLGVEFET
jgi:hypothetical protein